ncbi:MAG: M20/M25/M40 family metallo-hydrolase [Halieaceae bacterium]
MQRVLLIIISLLMSTAGYSDQNNRAVESLSQAIRYKTISHQNREDISYQEFDGFLEFLELRYPKSFSQLTAERVNKYNLLFRWPGKDATLKPVLFDGHYDVVPVEADTQSDWLQAPFSGAIVDGFVWGRGSVDDKSAVISLLESIEALVDEGFKPERTLLFSIVHDEEIGGREGAIRIAERLLSENTQLEYMVGEGGFLVDDSPVLPAGHVLAMISTAEKRYVTLVLTAKGEGGHSSKPPRNSAIAKLAKAVTLLHEEPFAPELVAPTTDMFSALAPYHDGIEAFMMSNPGLFGGLMARGMSDDENLQGMVRTTTAITMIGGGIKENVVPQSASASVNFRLLPNITPDELKEIVRDKIDDPTIAIAFSDSVSLGENLPIADKNGMGFKAISDSILAVEPEAVVVPGLFLATTDTRHYGKLTKNIYRFHASMSLSTEDAAVVHGTNERISVQALERAINITTQLVRRAGSN